MNIAVYQKNSHDHLIFLKDILQENYKNIVYTDNNPNMVIITDKFLHNTTITNIKHICDIKNKNIKYIFYFSEIVDYLKINIPYYESVKTNKDLLTKLKMIENVCDLVCIKSHYNPFKNIPFLYIPEYLIYENYNLSFNEFKQLIYKNPHLNPNGNSKIVKMFSGLTNERQRIITAFSKKYNIETIKTENHFSVNGFRENHRCIYPNFNYSLSIENCHVKGYATEKLLQPLLGNCIPIYYDPCNNVIDTLINENNVVKIKNIDEYIDLHNIKKPNFKIFKDDSYEKYIEFVDKCKQTIMEINSK